LLKISFIFPYLAYILYNALVATDLHDWRRRRACCRFVRRYIPKNLLKISYILLCLAYMKYNLLGEAHNCASAVLYTSVMTEKGTPS
jgi:hypothetical protein